MFAILRLCTLFLFIAFTTAYNLSTPAKIPPLPPRFLPESGSTRRVALLRLVTLAAPTVLTLSSPTPSHALADGSAEDAVARIAARAEAENAAAREVRRVFEPDAECARARAEETALSI